MKFSVVAFSILMVMAFSSLASSRPMSSSSPTTCCFFYVKNQIPRKAVIDHYKISSLCSKPAVVFMTAKGLKLCANPRDAWVREYINDLESSPKPEGK